MFIRSIATTYHDKARHRLGETSRFTDIWLSRGTVIGSNRRDGTITRRLGRALLQTSLLPARSYGFIRLEDLPKSLPYPAYFKFGFERIPVIIPTSIMEEVNRISQPRILPNGTASYVFDFMTCRLDQSHSSTVPNAINPTDFAWVEIKTGGSRQSANQIRTSKTCNIRYNLFRVQVLCSPEEVEIEWPFDSHRFR